MKRFLYLCILALPAAFHIQCGNPGVSSENDVGPATDIQSPDPGADASPIPWWQQEWRMPDRKWPDCTPQHGTQQSLSEKAAYYQWLVPRLHRLEGQAADGRPIVHALFHHTCLDGPVPTAEVPDSDLPAVIRFGSYGNTGLWTALYVASQAFRYAVAKQVGDDPVRDDALNEVKITLEAIYRLLRITGKEGLFARGYWSPLPQFSPPEPGGDTHFVDDGEFAGYTWIGDVSQDEYSGHMYALGVVARLVDDPWVQETCRDIAQQVGNHLMDHHLWITDVDGEPTKYGKMSAWSFMHFPGYNAWQVLTWIKMAAVISGDPVLDDYFHDCLLQEQGEQSCIDQEFEVPTPYTEHLDTLDVMQGCATNHDSVSMAFLAADNLIGYEDDADRRKSYQRTLHDKLVVGDVQGRNITEHGNAFLNMIYASRMDYDDPTATQPEPLIRDALCTLKEFPEDKRYSLKDTMHYPHFCDSERHGSLAESPIPWREHPVYIFLFWRSPYERQHEDETIRCGDDPGMEPPADYLLPYWMGRYYGWISQAM